MPGQGDMEFAPPLDREAKAAVTSVVREQRSTPLHDTSHWDICKMDPRFGGVVWGE